MNQNKSNVTMPTSFLNNQSAGTVDTSTLEEAFTAALAIEDGSLPPDLIAAATSTHVSISCKAGESRKDTAPITVTLAAPLSDGGI